MPFVYRLQKILDFRIRRKEEQLLVVQKAQREVNIAQQNIERNNQEIEITKVNQSTADALMMESYDKYIHYLWEKAEHLEAIKQEKLRILQAEISRLVEFEKAVKVLEKHKEKAKDIYLEEEKQAELKQLSEIAVQRHFHHTKERVEEEGEEIIKQLELMESEMLNEY